MTEKVVEIDEDTHLIDTANFEGRRAKKGRCMKNAIEKQAAAPSKHIMNPTSLQYKDQLNARAFTYRESQEDQHKLGSARSVGIVPHLLAAYN